MIRLVHQSPAPMVGGVVRAACRSPPSIIFFSKRKRWVAARLGGEASNLNLEAALKAASLRFQETLRPDPLFIDPYAQCLLSSDVVDCGTNRTSSSSVLHYRLTTKFIDDKILHEISSSEELRQIVLLTDGMDTRPYRLNWPRFTVIYDISPGIIYEEACRKLQGSGAKVSKSCMMIHTSLESADLQMFLLRKGFSGNKPSLWALQGLPVKTLSDFEDILSIVSSLTVKGCLFIGELPSWLHGAEFEDKIATQRWMEKLFLGHGFQIRIVDYNELAKNMHDVPKENTNLLFIARQLRLSDAQMDAWRARIERLDEEGDEEGFEEL